MTLEAIKYNNGKLELLDQLKLPFESVYLNIETVQDGWNAIHKMNVRGAPAIAIAGALSVAVELVKREFKSTEELKKFIFESLDYLITSRPTAVNMADAATKIKEFFLAQETEISDVKKLNEKVIEKITSMLKEDIDANKSMGNFGAADILKNFEETRSHPNKKVNILTHCNTGSLATAGYGTALGVVRRLQELGELDHCYCTETRPYNQGARLTAYELVYEHIPATLVCDDMVGLLLKRRPITAIVVGADRVVANGDTANKIGTYQLAILARFHNVPFYVAVPSTTIDLTKRTGDEIVIEERPAREMTHIQNVPVAAQGINCWNPAFDVTPGELVTGGFITEFGVFKAHELEEKISSILNKKN